MSDGVWAAQLVDPDGHEETISSADPNTIVWWLERQAQRLDPKPACGFKGCLVREAHFHAAGGPAEPGAPFGCPKMGGCDQLALCLADRGCRAIPPSGS